MMAGATVGVGLINRGLIGRGSFGRVYLVENRHQEEFAVKVMELLHADDYDRIVAENEARILQRLNHRHVLEYVGHFYDRGLLYLITEYCSGGDINAFLDRTQCPVPEDLLRVWLWQIACGLEYMHTYNAGRILHRDLKPSNIYLSETGDIILGDVGISRILDRPGDMADTFCGTPQYMSPEALREQSYDEKTDIWSMGCCVMEMATLDRAYKGANLKILRDAVKKRRQPLPEPYSGELDRLVSNMLLLDSRNRSSASALLGDGVLKGCEDIKPMHLLARHNVSRDTWTSSTMSTTTSSTTSTADTDDSLLSLERRMDDIGSMVDDGESYSSYLSKLSRRQVGRRREEDTLTSSSRSSSGKDTLNLSDSQKTVLSINQTVVHKTEKKTLRVPKVVKPEAAVTPEQDHDLAMSVLSSMVSALAGIGQPKTESRPNPSEAPQLPTANPGSEASRPSLKLLQEAAAQRIGEATLCAARTVVNNAASTNDEVQRGLVPLVGEQGSLLNNIVIYMLLKETVTQSASGSF